MSSKWHHNFPKIAREAGFIIRELAVGHSIDWRFVASIDPYCIVSEQDYEKLDEFIPHISEVPIGSVLNNRILDPAIGKYFTLAQFCIQYLLFCKQFLDETVVEIRNALQRLQDENVRLEKMNKKRNDETVILQRKLLRAENINHQQTQQTTVFPCTRCTKNFISEELLNAHIVRKHANTTRLPENSSERKSSNTDTSLINTIKLELEVKQLKERLNVAEKDLLNHRSKHHRCHVCSEDHFNAHDEPKAKILYNIGIQTNLTDDKDCNEKGAQTQTEPTSADDTNTIGTDPSGHALPQGDVISKSDLQAFIEEQNRLFECWKDGERQKFDKEIKTVQQNLVDAIRTIQNTEKPSTPVPVCDDVGWKERYQELAKMFENSQQQTRDTMKAFEGAYTQKMEHIQTILAKILVSGNKESSSKSDATKLVAETLSKQLTSLRMVTLPEIVIEGEQGECGSMSESNINKITSSESEYTPESEEELQCLDAPKIHSAKPGSTLMGDAPRGKAKDSPKAPPTVLPLTPKKQIMSQFRARLKVIGIDIKSKQLSGEGLHDACDALATRRDVLKKKHKHFFITRNQLLSKLDKIARAKIAESTNAVPQDTPRMVEEKPTMPNNNVKLSSVTRMPSTVNRLQSSPTLELLPSKQTLIFPGMTTNQTTGINIFKTKAASTISSTAVGRPIIKLTGDDVITVHAEVNASGIKSSFPPPPSPTPTTRPSGSTYGQHIEKLLDTPIKTINPINPVDISAARQDHWEDGFGEKTSDVSEMLDATPAQPKPIPKKRVLFNLDKPAHNTSISGPQTNIKYKTAAQRSKLEEESDWNISSFDEDK